jgi:hypothetical protein
VIELVNKVFSRIESVWKHDRTHRYISLSLVLSFVLSLIIIELRRRSLLPASWANVVPNNHFFAVNLAFTLLLLIEVISLVFNLVYSVSEAVGKQLEILSLILIRQSFKEFVYFEEPIRWTQISTPVLHILCDAAGALAIFIALGFYYRFQKHRPFTRDMQEQQRFVSTKKVLALLLLVGFAWIGLSGLARHLLYGTPLEFFDVFFTVLIFYDILVVFISLRYTSTYHVVFRNSGFALSTVVIRLAVIAPPFLNVLLGIGAALLTLGLTVAYNRYVPVIQED